MIRLVQSAVAAALLLASPALAADKYVVDNAKTKVYALAYKGGAASAVAHDHVVRAGDVSGSAMWDSANPSTSSISVTVKATSLVPDEDSMRAYVGLPNKLSEGQRNEIQEHIFAKYQLWTDTYNTVTFQSTGVAPVGNQFQVTGNFTLRGVSKPIAVLMTITPDGNALHCTGRFKLNQSDYGYAPYSALLGALKVKDTVDIVLDFRLVPG